MNELDIITDNLDDMAEFIDNRRLFRSCAIFKRIKTESPKYVINWYEEHIYHGIADAIRFAQDVDSLEDQRVYNWFQLLSDEESAFYDDTVVQTLVRMYLFGYEVV